jgi:hypothetical protein
VEYKRSQGKVQQFLNPNLFPGIVSDARIERATGFDSIDNAAANSFFVRRDWSFPFLEEVDFNISAQCACEVFWQMARDHHLNDPLQPRLVAASPATSLLQQNVVHDAFTAGVFHRISAGKQLVLFIGDHTGIGDLTKEATTD